jgi:hypothetical protein
MRYARLPLFVLLCGLLVPQPQAAASSLTLAGPFLASQDSLPPLLLPYVRHIGTLPEHPIGGQAVTLLLGGEFPYPCGEAFDPTLGDPLDFAIGLRPVRACTDTSRSWRWAFDLGTLRAGFYSVEIQLHVVADPAAPPGTPVLVYRGRYEFSVARTDTNPPPPPTGPLPFVDTIWIGPEPDDLGLIRRICAYDSIPVSIEGTFPNDCFRLKEIRLVRVQTFRYEPGPPQVLIIVDDGGCLGRPCLGRPTPWAGSVALEGLPAGRYPLTVQLGLTSCSDSIPPDRLYTTHVPFTVDSCGIRPPQPPMRCLLGTWDHPRGPGNCDAFVGSGEAARVTFMVRSMVALSGLEGDLRFIAPGLRITRLEPVGPAAGMHLSWSATLEGARFVMFAERGAPIPARVDDTPPVLVPVLGVTVDQAPGAPPGPRGYLVAEHLLGSDIDGQGVPECPLATFAPADIRLIGATICTERECDFNLDGRTDVRDLVTMVHCLHHEGRCPDTTGTGYDCNQDGQFSLDDVICCARRMLGRAPCPGCPPDTAPRRPEPQVRFAFGDARAEGGVMSLPLRLEGTGRLGAARFALRYPADRYDVSAVEFPGKATRWLALDEVQDGQVVIALIQTSPETDGADADGPLDVMLRLALKPGRTAGGEVSCADAEFSGPDGVPLEIAMTRPVLPLGGPIRIALSENRPNPFSSETRFSLTLDQSADVEVGVYDVGGRLVASLHHGHLAAGTSEFGWSGRGADGGAASHGIYFYRAVVQGRTVSRKMVLLGNN